MDIFGDKHPDEDFAYKEFRVLEASSSALDTKDSSGKYTSFNMEVGGIVEIADVTNNGDGIYTVKFKALKTGTETITVGKAKLILEVQAELGIYTTPGEIKQAQGESSSLELDAKSSSGEMYSHKASWKVSIQDASVANIGGGVGVSEKTLTSNTCNIVSKNPGKTQIIVTATCRYNGQDYSVSEYMTLQTYGVIGLSNNGLGTVGASTAFFNETSRASDGEHNGVNKNYTSSPKPEMEDDGTVDVFLYESYEDEALGRATIKNAWINGTEVTSIVDDGSNKTYTPGDYVLDIGSAADSISNDGDFRYRSIKVRPATGKVGGNVSVKFKVADGDEENASYILGGNILATHVITFDANYEDADELSVKSLHADANGKVTFTSYYPTRTGYKFKGWSTDKNGTTAEYCTGSGNNDNKTYTGLTEDITLYAIWDPISYKIVFDPGYGTMKSAGDNLDAIDNVLYDEEITLPTKGETNDKYQTNVADTFFVGWNTEKNGSGISYKPGATVKNLTDEDNATVTLYAQWRDKYRLTFADIKEGKISKKSVEISAGSDSYTVTSADLPSNVEAKSVGGEYGYYWTSSSGKEYRLAGWDVDRTKKPEEVAYKITFSGNTPTFPTITGIDGDQTFFTIWEDSCYKITLIDNLTGGGPLDPDETFHQRGLSRAVLPHQGMHGSRTDIQVDALERLHARKLFRDVFHLKDVLAHELPPFSFLRFHFKPSTLRMGSRPAWERR